MVIAVFLRYGAGEAVVQDLPSGRNGKAERQGLIRAGRGSVGDFNHGLEAGALGNGGRVKGLAVFGHIFHLKLETVGEGLPTWFTCGGEYGAVELAVSAVHNLFLILLHAGGACRNLVIEVPVSYRRKGRFLGGEVPCGDGFGGQGKGIGNSFCAYQSLKRNHPVTGGCSISDIVRLVFREVLAYSFKEGIGLGLLAGEGVSA